MLSMYAKLFSRISQSSLMEEDVHVRYCFMMFLAIADQNGDVIGTDVAIARHVNLPLEKFTECVKELMSPDANSNSPEHEGRRVIESENGRGYHVVNYTKYRLIKTDEEKRTYMREYMRRRRNSKNDSNVTDVKIGKVSLGDVTHAEAETEAELPPIPQGDQELIPKITQEIRNTPETLRLRAIFNQRPDTKWSDRTMKLYRKMTPIPEEEFKAVEKYQQVNRSTPNSDYSIRDLETLLSKWSAIVDRGRNIKDVSIF